MDKGQNVPRPRKQPNSGRAATVPRFCEDGLATFWCMAHRRGFATVSFLAHLYLFTLLDTDKAIQFRTIDAL